MVVKEGDNMELTLSEKLTYSTIRLTCKNNSGLMSIGTAFVMSFCFRENRNVPVLITNRHVVENCDIFEFEFCTAKEDGSPDDLKTKSITLKNVNWINHPNKAIDLCCLPIAPILKEATDEKIRLFYIPLGIDSLPSTEIISKFSASEEVVMIGYPIGIYDTYNHKPIIRRGITATHIKKKYCGKNEFLVDMACFPGSSGSPICILNEGSYVFENNVCVGTRFFLAGILYAGPQYDAEGNVKFSEVPTIKTSTSIPTNLGLVIRSDELLEFERLFSNLLSLTESKDKIK